MNETITKIKNSSFISILKAILSSKYFPFISAVITLLCYYLSLDIVLIYYCGITGILIMLLLDDVTPVISVFLFMSILISYNNSPSNIMGHSDYYSQPAIFVQAIIVIVLFAAATASRGILAGVRKKFCVDSVLIGLGVFSAVLLFNGLFSEDYNPKNMIYGLIMALCFFGIYASLKDNLVLNRATFEKIAFALFALSIVLVIELAVTYFTTKDIIVNGSVNRNKLTFGWGMWNTMGMMLVICIPAPLYLAGIKKFGFLFTLYSLLLFAACVMTFSRQSILGAVIIYAACAVILLIKGKNRLANIIIFAAAVVAGIILLGIFHDTVLEFFKDFFSKLIVNGEISGNGRTKLWKGGIHNFKSAPFFGVGFYSDLYSKYLGGWQGYSGLGFVPQMCHDTFIELLSACGLFGIASYLLHRVQTFISFFKNITVERTFIGMTILSLLIVSLVDNHIFNIFPTIIYSALLAVLVGSEKKTEGGEQKPAEIKVQ